MLISSGGRLSPKKSLPISVPQSFCDWSFTVIKTELRKPLAKSLGAMPSLSDTITDDENGSFSLQTSQVEPIVTNIVPSFLKAIDLVKCLPPAGSGKSTLSSVAERLFRFQLYLETWVSWAT